MSYTNLIMYSSTLPSSATASKKNNEKDTINADDSNNIEKIDQFGND